MAFEVYWDSREYGRLVLEFSSTVTWEDFSAAAQQAHAVALAARQSITLVIWAKTPFPDGLALWHFGVAFRAQPPNIQQTIIIPEKTGPVLTFAKSLAGIIWQVYPAKSPIRFADSMEEARMLSTTSAVVTNLE